MITYKTLGIKDYLHALDNKEFKLAYQPIMNFKVDTFETFEAFIRWHNPELGTLPPSIFMNDIEKYDLQEKLTGYIIDAAIHQISVNQSAGYGETGININLTLQEFYNVKTIEQLKESIKKISCPELLGIEISPKILSLYKIQNPDDADYHADFAPTDKEKPFLDNIKKVTQNYLDLGVTIALDTTDEVIGSLIRADYLGIHAVKVSAKCLQRALFTDSALLEEYVKASQDFNIPLIAVGLENNNLFKLAYNNDFQYAQGLFLCPPLCLDNPNTFQDYLTNYHRAKENLLTVNNSVEKLKNTAEKMGAAFEQDIVKSSPINQNILEELRRKKQFEEAINNKTIQQPEILYSSHDDIIEPIVNHSINSLDDKYPYDDVKEYKESNINGYEPNQTIPDHDNNLYQEEFAPLQSETTLYNDRIKTEESGLKKNFSFNKQNNLLKRPAFGRK